MKLPTITRARRIFRSPRMIVGALAGLAILGVIGAVVPQAGTASSAGIDAFRQGNPLAASLAAALGLDHLFRGPVFLGLALLTAISLAVIVVEQLGRLRAAWSHKLTEAHFLSAPFQTEFDRPARAGTMPGRPSLKTWTENRLGLAGSAVLHLGLLLLIIAGAGRAFFGADAAVDLIEGETLSPGAQAWGAQWPGLCRRPFALETPVTFDRVLATRYPGGSLREYKATLSFVSKGGRRREAELAANRDLQTPAGRLYLDSEFGVAALVQWEQGSAAPVRQAALLSDQGKGRYEAALAGPDGLTAFLRAEVDEAGHRAPSLEVRVMNTGALVGAADLRIGSALSLPDGRKLVLAGSSFWARLRGSRDPGLWLAYAGISLAIAGVALIFLIIKADYCVRITPVGDRELVFVAIKPHRFAPLFADRFKQLLREHEGVTHPALPPNPIVASLRSPLVGGLALVICLALLAGCQKPLSEQARQLVERYNRVVAEAYRRGDVKLVDPVVGDQEGKKLTGLIGVRLELGLTLDSELLELQILRAEKSRDVFQVWTRERWRYRDRKIGSGAQVGEESLDDYEMRYVFKRKDRTWLAEELHFNSPPRVGRRQMTWLAERAPADAGGHTAGTGTKQRAGEPLDASLPPASNPQGGGVR